MDNMKASHHVFRIQNDKCFSIESMSGNESQHIIYIYISASRALLKTTWANVKLLLNNLKLRGVGVKGDLGRARVRVH